MTRITNRLLAVLLLVTIGCNGESVDADAPEASPESATQSEPGADRAGWVSYFADVAASAPDHQVIEGQDGWLYFAPELRHLGLDSFWGAAAAEVSRADDPTHADPLAAILDFKAQLDSIDVRLIFVPVPAKAAIYPSPLPGDAPGSPSADARADAADAAFLEVLKKNGVETIDLAPTFLEAHEGRAPVYCQQDTHWSPRGAAIAGNRIADVIGARDWRAAQPTVDYETVARPIAIRGDLHRRIGSSDRADETLEATFVTQPEPAGRQPVGIDRDSPVLLLADSHGLVFHAGGDMHATGAGLPEHLARSLGFPVDLIAVRGSGATPARIDLLRRGDDLAGKKVVVWVISVREYTEGQGWAKVPVIKAADA